MPVEYLDLPPADAVRHFRAKGVHVGFDWRTRPEHLAWHGAILPGDSPATVTLSGKAVRGHRKRFSEELSAEDWERVQQIVDHGSRASPDRERRRRWRRASWVDDETNKKKVWLLVLDKAPSSEEAHLITYLKTKRQYAIKGTGGG